jgi:SNF2 family DNA or RNA helicase
MDNAFKILIDIEGNKVIALSAFNDGDRMRHKSAGGRWDPKERYWWYPLLLESCRQLRKTFGDRLQISPELSAWAWEERAAEERLAELVKQDSAELQQVPAHSPVLFEAMKARTYQQVGARFIAETGNCLIADEPGLGKTLEAVAGLMESDRWHGPILIAAPLTSLRNTWQRELTRFVPDAHVTIGVPSSGDAAWARRDLMDDWLQAYLATPHEPHILVVNPEMVREAETKFPVIAALEWTAVVLDESHKYLSGVRSATNLTKVGKAMLALKTDCRIALSGTPMKGKPQNLWGTLHWLQPSQYTSFWKWADRYLYVGRTRYGYSVSGIKPWMEADLYKSLDRIMLRRTKMEVVPELPPKQHIDVVCEMPPVQAKQYSQMAKQSFAELGDEKITAVGVLAIMTRLKQMATCSWKTDGADLKPKAIMDPKFSGKTAAIEQMLVERGIAGDSREGEDKIVIASQFTEVINSLADYLKSIKVEYMMITGAVTESKRVVVTQAFQSAGGPRVLLMNTTAGGVSITLDAYCSELIIIDETWVPDDQEQLEDRIHRVSRIHQVMIYRLITAETIDEYINEVTISKDTVQKRLLDGRRGVELAMRLTRGKSKR